MLARDRITRAPTGFAGGDRSNMSKLGRRSDDIQWNQTQSELNPTRPEDRMGTTLMVPNPRVVVPVADLGATKGRIELPQQQGGIDKRERMLTWYPPMLVVPTPDGGPRLDVHPPPTYWNITLQVAWGGDPWKLTNEVNEGVAPILQPYGPLQHWHESKQKLKISSVEYQPSRQVDVLRTWETIMNPYIAGDIKAQYNQRQTERRQRMSQWETPTPTPQPLDDHHNHGGDDDPYGYPLSPTGGDNYISSWGSEPSGPRGVEPTAGRLTKAGHPLTVEFPAP